MRRYLHHKVCEYEWDLSSSIECGMKGEKMKGMEGNVEHMPRINKFAL